ncbi:hypothetical protein [Flavivirga sp. 57AJ16]|uniref:hypothetical protein n=1 Tax=Flavivirga sp. 57AJ16 TaxID=3025307 RepID=UPI00236619B0|nr:hypothetical protein [Flavivirga sp. 57AJ16]MDD7886235.1 hypothetical protein [Flavivirga sp. 57AJ16]
MAKIYFAITIDTECDKGANWKVKQPLRFLNIYNGLVNNLQPIFDKYKVKATYLLSPEVMMDKESVTVFKGLGNKVELGTHLHSEFIEPQANFNSESTNYYQKDFKPDIEEKKLENLTHLFEKKFGYNPLSFRAGRFGISNYSLQFLQKLGYKVDSSVTPDMYWKSKNGNSVNFMGSLYQPYYPESTDFRKAGYMDILEVPVTLINRRLRKLPPIFKRYISFTKSYHHIIFNYITGFSKPVWLRPTYSNIKTMKMITNDFVSMAKEKDVFLCMMFHSNEFEVNTSPYSLTKKSMNRIIKRLDGYLEWVTSNKEVCFVGLSEIPRVILKL